MSTESRRRKAITSSICSASGPISTERYETDLSEPTRALLDGYAAGVNLYAAQHRGDVLPEAVPVKGQDIVALFMLRLPFFYGLDEQLRVLLAGGEVEIPPRKTAAARALAIAIAPSRSADGATRLLLNPQGPFAGPLSWYEARVTSGEGLERRRRTDPRLAAVSCRRRAGHRLGVLGQSSRTCSTSTRSRAIPTIASSIASTGIGAG